MVVVQMVLQNELVNVFSNFLFEFLRLFFLESGPNNEGCGDGDEVTVTVSNSTVVIANETDSISANETEAVALTTEKNDVTFETSTENVTVIFNEINSTLSETENVTASVLEETTTNDLENTTINAVENNTSIVSENTTMVDEVSEGSTTESIETTTQAETTTTVKTTTVRSNLCVDSEFECCPDGKTFAKVIESLRRQIIIIQLCRLGY